MSAPLPAAPPLDTLEDCRAAINTIDEELVRLLHQRAVVSLAVGRYKRAYNLPIFQPEREAELLERLAHKRGPLPEASLRTIYAAILQASRDLQTGPEE